jgi:hypothetical protein
MTEPRIATRSVSRDVVETGPIVLRESDTRRLVFLTTMLDRAENASEAAR